LEACGLVTYADVNLVLLVRVHCGGLGVFCACVVERGAGRGDGGMAWKLNGFGTLSIVTRSSFWAPVVQFDAGKMNESLSMELARPQRYSEYLGALSRFWFGGA
jgi:hypothetical protein